MCFSQFLHLFCVQKFHAVHFSLFFVKNISSVQCLETMPPKNKKGESGARKRKTRSDIEKETVKEHDGTSSEEKEKMIVKN